MEMRPSNMKDVPEMKTVEDAISACYERVYQLKVKLTAENLANGRRDHLKQELQEVEKRLLTNKTILNSIRKNNRKTFMLSVAILLGIVMVWMLFHLVY